MRPVGGAELMEVFSILMSLVLCGLFVYLFVWWNRRNTGRGRPPGPIAFPIVGSLPQVAYLDWNYTYKAFSKLAKRYGNVMSLKLGVVDTVVLNGHDTIKKALQGDDFLERMDDDWMLHRAFGKRIGLSASHKDLWLKNRKVTIRHLRVFGFGKKEVMEGLVFEEFEQSMEKVATAVNEHGSIVLDPRKLFRLAGFNMSWASIAGERLNHEDPKILAMSQSMSEYFKGLKFAGGYGQAFPFLRKLFPWKFGFAAAFSIDDKMHEYIRELIDDVRQKGRYQTNPQSLIEVFLQRIDSLDEDEDGDDSEIYTEENLIVIIYDIFSAASESLSTHMDWVMLWMTAYPEVQEKCYREITAKIGNQTLPRMSDKASLPFVRATILEMHRNIPSGPILARKVYKDTHFESYIIPKNTLIVLNMYSAEMDDAIWDDPEEFMPQRFLDENNDVINDTKTFPFGGGKRSCLGQPVAEAFSFLAITRLIQKYQLLPARPGQKLDTKPIYNLFIQPPPYEIKFQLRAA